MKGLFIVLTLSYLALSHDLWIEKWGDAYVLYYGHIQPRAGEESKIAYSPENLLRFECLDGEGKVLKATVDKGYPAKLRGNCSLLQAEFSSGYWTKTVSGTKNLPKDKVSGALEGWLSLEVVRRVERWNSNMAKALTEGLELVLLEDPSKLRMEQKFSVGVYYGGKPLKDVTVSHNGRVVGTTDEGGRINLRIRSPGLQHLSVSYREKGDGVKADYIVRTFNLVFEVGR
ncbi:MAG: DUF4198 domain-containing protein [Aquificaceae bacterium]